MDFINTTLSGLKSLQKAGLLVFACSFGIHVFAQNENQSIATDLVGKWCYINLTTTSDAITNSCIALKDDGTYELTVDRSTLPQGGQFPALKDSDLGTWWVNGNKISYKSNTSGMGSFVFQKANHPRLDNTPMILINGVAFANASQHSPW